MDTESLWIVAIHWLLAIFIYSILGSIISAPIAKFYARSISIYRHWLIAFWAFIRGISALALIWVFGTMVVQQPNDVLSWIVFLAALCGIGWLISLDLKRRGVGRGFPGIGARAITGVVLCLCVIAAAHLLVSMLLVRS